MDLTYFPISLLLRPSCLRNGEGKEGRGFCRFYPFPLCPIFVHISVLPGLSRDVSHIMLQIQSHLIFKMTPGLIPIQRRKKDIVCRIPPRRPRIGLPDVHLLNEETSLRPDSQKRFGKSSFFLLQEHFLISSPVHAREDVHECQVERIWLVLVVLRS